MDGGGINRRKKQVVTAADRFPSTGEIAMESKALTVKTQDEHIRESGREEAIAGISQLKSL